MYAYSWIFIYERALVYKIILSFEESTIWYEFENVLIVRVKIYFRCIIVNYSSKYRDCVCEIAECFTENGSVMKLHNLEDNQDDAHSCQLHIVRPTSRSQSVSPLESDAQA